MGIVRAGCAGLVFGCCGSGNFSRVFGGAGHRVGGRRKFQGPGGGVDRERPRQRVRVSGARFAFAACGCVRGYFEAGPVLLRIFGPGFFPLRVRDAVAPGQKARPPGPVKVGGACCGCLMRPRRGARVRIFRAGFGPFPAQIIPLAPAVFQAQQATFCAVCSKVILCFKSKICWGLYLVIMLTARALSVRSCTCNN